MVTTATSKFIDGLADFWVHSKRSPVLRRPSEVGLEYEDVFFPSMDGVTLDGWFIPAESNRLIIHNHFMPGNRYGYPGQLEGFNDFGGFEVTFLPAYRALHDAGYNVLCYDMRNHGLSGSGNGGIVGIGLLEYRDVIGSIRYAESRPDTAEMTTGLLSVCLGCNSTIVAMDRHPAELAHIKALLGLQPISARPFIERAVEAKGIEGGVKLFDAALYRRTGFHIDEQSPIPHAKAVQVPTLIAQVHDDKLTRRSDVQAIYDNIGASDKRLFWIEGTDQRFRGYNYFGEHPELMIEWFDTHMK